MLPPPVAEAVLLLGFTLLLLTLTGIVTITVPVAAPLLITQPAILLAPDAGQPFKEPPVAVITPLVVMPVGNVSVKIKSAVVGPSLMAIVIAYDCPVLSTTKGV